MRAFVRCEVGARLLLPLLALAGTLVSGRAEVQPGSTIPNYPRSTSLSVLTNSFVLIWDGTASAGYRLRSMSVADLLATGNMPAAITLDSEWDSVSKMEAVWSLNILTGPELDSQAELEALIGVNLATDSEMAAGLAGKADSIHTHSAVDINSGTLAKARGGSGQDNSSLSFPGSGTLATLSGTETLANKTLTTPTIGSMANAQHNHQNAAGGGALDAAAIGSGTVAKARGGSGQDNSSLTFPSSGTLATLNGSEVLANKTLTTPTINSTRYTPIDLGTGTSFALDPVYSRYVATASGNFTINLATNSVTAGVEIEPIYLSVYSASAYTASLSSSGTGGTAFTGGEKRFGWGTNVAGSTNVYIGYWDGYVWHFDLNTAQMSATQLGNGTVDDAEYSKLNNVNSTILTDISTNVVYHKTYVQDRVWLTYTGGTNLSGLDLNTANHFAVVLTNNAYLGPPSNGLSNTNQVQTFQLDIIQDSLGGRSFTFNGCYTAAGGTYSITTNASKMDILTFKSSARTSTNFVYVPAQNF